MPQRPMSQCKRVGCPNLVQGPGWCPKHTIDFEAIRREQFKRIDEKKTPESRRFYSSAAWTRASRLHREKEPLCRRCRAEGKIRIGALSHHNPPLKELLERGLNPFDDQYLETICTPHHQQELSRKAKSC